MPGQETFMDTVIDGRRVQVVKTYDQAYAKEVFDEMTDEAKAVLWASLNPEEKYEPDDLPKTPGVDYDAFLLDELIDEGREDWRLFSYFIVIEHRDDGSTPVFVSPDWPTAEAMAKASPAEALRTITRSDNRSDAAPGI